jgi:hypothetical protein
MVKSDSGPRKPPMKKYPTIAACGLDCGLCPRFYTVGPSRCPGCAGPGFHRKHPTCSFLTCCVRNKNLEVCGECSDFPCAKFKSAEEYKQMKASSSYPSPGKMLPNLYFVQAHGMKSFVEQQSKRITALQTMIREFDDGRSRSFFCRAATVHDPPALAIAIKRAAKILKARGTKKTDKKSRADTLCSSTFIFASLFSTFSLQFPVREVEEIGPPDFRGNIMS